MEAEIEDGHFHTSTGEPLGLPAARVCKARALSRDLRNCPERWPHQLRGSTARQRVEWGEGYEYLNEAVVATFDCRADMPGCCGRLVGGTLRGLHNHANSVAVQFDAGFFGFRVRFRSAAPLEGLEHARQPRVETRRMLRLFRRSGQRADGPRREEGQPGKGGEQHAGMSRANCSRYSR